VSRLLRSIAAECRLVVQAYLILQLEAYTLLAAAIAGFLALTIVMFVILRVDWSAGAVLAPLRAVPGCSDYRAAAPNLSLGRSDQRACGPEIVGPAHLAAARDLPGGSRSNVMRLPIVVASGVDALADLSVWGLRCTVTSRSHHTCQFSG
jgi:hypothetical protein